MTEEKLKELLKKFLRLPKETEWLEFKEAKRNFDFDKLGKYFSALCNEANLKNEYNGWLIFGIDNQRNIIGSRYRLKRSQLDNLKSEIANHTTGRVTFVDIHELSISSSRVVIFQIPAAPKGIPIAWKGHYYGRDDEELTALNIQEIEQIRNQAQASDWSYQICEGATIDDLDEEAIQKAKAGYKNKNPHLISEIDNWNNITFLNKVRVTRQGKITRTAIILLGKDESEHFLSPSVARITWLLRDEKSTDKDYHHFGPPFVLNVEKVFAKVRNINYRYLPDGTLFPIEITQYDPWVIREALHNCIAHQDYELSGRINIIENPDELIFTNVGGFIPGDVETYIQQNSPPEIYRNPFLAQAMVNLNMIDIIGSGIKRMFQKQRERVFPLPDYDLSTPNRVKVKISGKILDENYTRLLIKNTDMDLTTAILLDKVQKGIKITREAHKILKLKKFVEGRYPNLFVSSQIASITGEKAKYIKLKGFDKKYYQDLIVEFIKKHGSASRAEINDLLSNKLPDKLTEKQKRSKISNLLTEMTTELNTIKNIGSKKNSKWILTSE